MACREVNPVRDVSLNGVNRAELDSALMTQKQHVLNNHKRR